MNLFDIDDDEYGMEMPCPCQKCDRIFDLNDGYASEKWFKGTIICEKCHDEEEQEIEEDERAESIYDDFKEAAYSVVNDDPSFTEDQKKDILKTCNEMISVLSKK